MNKYIFIAIIIPVSIFFSALNLTALKNFDNYFKPDSAGRILGAREASGDSSGQVMIAEKQYDGQAVEIISNNQDGHLPEIMDISTGVCLPNSGNKKFGPVKIADYQEINIDCSKSCALDLETGKAIYDKNKDEAAPIASITKLMTALVFLDHNPGWDTIYEISREDRIEGGKEYLFLGEKATVKDLFYTSLVGSANGATLAMVHSTGMTEKQFVEEMNKKAASFGLLKTNFEDATGLSNKNISTAHETAMLAKYALEQEEINKATLKKIHEFKTVQGAKKKIYTTDYLLENFSEDGIRIIGGKTGYTEAAKYCFVGIFTDKNGNRIITSVLGGDSKNSRFSETKKLAEWVYGNYIWD